MIAVCYRLYIYVLVYLLSEHNLKNKDLIIITHKKALGAWGEQVAADFLKSRGYEIITRNYRCRYGEIDLICKENSVWCFVEVKTRKSDAFGQGYLSVTPVKQRHMITAAFHYLDRESLNDVPARFDIISISFAGNSEYKIELIKNAFETSGRI